MKQDPKVMLMELANDVRSLNSSVMLISQKMRHVIRNEKILGRNLVVLYKKVKSGEIGASGKGDMPSDLSKRLSDIETNLQNLAEKTNMMVSETASMKNSMVTEDQLKELKYVIDAINPLSYVTLDQAKQMIDDKMAEMQAKRPATPRR
ncbi:MAG: hypothetical protein COT15_05280 [Candidatus Diapherotrites archaeon CG08_land_8_20_14_0_20_34_12]|nr:MAG: hypothetical protein COT15_05280 [Candidatus Diapherotrites archaeon CG08_land_8_20_14_0_20_34_12]